MPIRHCVLFTFVDGVTPDQVLELQRRLLELPDLIPGLGRYQAGPNASPDEGNWDFAVTGEFESIDAFHAYVAHPAHVAVVQEHVIPLRDQRVAVQFEIP
jgi:hypothetical protein